MWNSQWVQEKCKTIKNKATTLTKNRSQNPNAQIQETWNGSEICIHRHQYTTMAKRVC